jgi:hypothetical protein
LEPFASLRVELGTLRFAQDSRVPEPGIIPVRLRVERETE